MQSNWISVDERMPPDMLDVLFFYVMRDAVTGEIFKKDIVCGHYEKGRWHICYFFRSDALKQNVEITHWQELPEYPL